MKSIILRLGIWLPLFMVGLDLDAQYQKRIDSLLTILPKSVDDTNKVKILRELSWNYGGLRSETATARAYADSMRMLSEQLGYEDGIMHAHLCYGMIDRYEGNYSQGLEHLQQFTEYFKHKNRPILEANGWFQIGTIHQERGDYDKALEAFEYILGNYEKAENWNGVVGTLNSIGIIYKRTGKFESAIGSYKKAVTINDQYQLGRDLTYIILNTGNAYAELTQYEEALGWYRKSLEICRNRENRYGIAANYANMGSVYSMMNKNDTALAYHTRALVIRETLPQKKNIPISLIEIGYNQLELGHLQSAEKSLRRALKLAQEIGTKAQIRDAYKHLSTTYATRNDFAAAYRYEQKYHNMKDSIFNEISTKQINELQTKYETAEKDKQIVVLAKEKQLQEKEAQRQATIKRASLGGLGLMSLLVALGGFMLYQRLKNQKIIAAKNDEVKEANFNRQLSELEMKALQAQMNPHFIFNCMNSINLMIQEGDDKNASKYLTKFSRLLRLILENAEEPEVSLKDELNMLEAYIQLEALRSKEGINYEINIQDQIDPESTFLPSMVLQPFVENAIWHGLIPKEEPGQKKVMIKIVQDQGKLKCMIEDNGVGREKALELRQKSVLKSKSLGLKITEERLKLLSDEIQKQLINITDLKDDMGKALGTKVEVNIPLA